MSINLVKTSPPHYTDNLVQRDCLDCLLQAHKNPQVKLILVEAAAGSGKSTLLLQVYNALQDKGEQLAWLSLGINDRDPISLLCGIATALQSQGGHVGGACLALLQAGAGIPANTILTTLFNEIYAYQKNITLFLDDLQLCESPENTLILQDMIENSPANLRLVIGSRVQPALNLVKLLARGQARRFSGEDIRASHSDTKLLFKKGFALNIDDEDIAVLVNRTDGWMNGLQIAALSLARRDNKKAYIKELKGSQQDISAYIDLDIYQKLPEHIKTFLAYSCVLEMFSTELCDAITQKNNSRELIDEVRQLNLFIIQLDEDNQWYRYHHLFNDFLQGQLAKLPAQVVHAIHERAYKWCLENHMYGEAVAHAITCQDYASACDAIEACRLEFMINNRISTLEQWIGQLPKDMLNKRPVLLLTLGWHHAMHRDFSRAMQYLQQIEQVLAAGNGTLKNMAPSQLKNDMAALKGVIAINRGNLNELLFLSNQGENIISEKDTIFDNAYLSSLVYAHVFVGRFDKAHRLAVELQTLNENNNILALVYSYIFRGWAYRQTGDFNNALLQYQQATIAAKAMHADKHLAFPAPAALQMELYYQWNDLDKALENMPNLHELAKDSSVVEPIICSHIISARLACLDGNEQLALQILAEAEAMAKRESCHLSVVSMLAERVTLLLKMNDADGAQDSAQDLYKECEFQGAVLKESALKESELAEGGLKESEGAFWLDSEYLRDLTIVALELYHHKIEKSPALIQHHIEIARREGRHFPLVNLLIHKSVLVSRNGKEKQGLKHMSEAIALAEKGGLIRIFLDAIPEALQILLNCLRNWEAQLGQLNQVVGQAYVLKLKSCFDITDQAPAPEAVSLEGLEPLTLREQELLRHLSAGLKNKELAQKLSLSENTIAWHLKNLYSKLRVSNRTSAVDVARKLHKL
ncbi:MAG: LuxR C-terminal-related transcriptional regulator [Bermanella sp.]